MQTHSKHKAQDVNRETKRAKRQPQALHRRLLRLYPVAAVFSVLGEIFAAIGALAIFGLLLALGNTDRKEAYYTFLLNEAEAAINRALPTYETKLGAVELEGDAKRTGIFVVRDIDIREKNGDDLIKVEEFRFTPEAPYKMLDGVQFTEFAFRNAEIEFTLEPRPGSERTSAETVIETIANQITDNVPFLTDEGKLVLLNSSVILKSPNGNKFFEAPNISARLRGDGGQYTLSVITSSSEERTDSFRANIYRNGDAVSIDGAAEEYAIAELDGALFSGEWESSFVVTDGEFRGIKDINGRFALDGAGYAGEIIGDFDEDLREFDVDNFNINFGQYSASGEGTIHEAKPYLVDFNFRDMNYPGIAVTPQSDAEGEDEASADGLVTFPEGGVSLRVDLENDRIDVGNFWVRKGETRVDGHGYFRAAGGLFGSFDLKPSDADIPTLIALWPKNVAESGYEFASQNLTEGRLEDSLLSLRVKTLDDAPVFDYEMKGRVENVGMRVSETIPQLRQLDGDFIVNNKTLVVATQNAQFTPQNATAPVTIEKADIFVDDFLKDSITGDIKLTARSKARDFIALISTPPLRFAQATKTNIADYKGDMMLNAEGQIPIKSGLKLADTNVTARAGFTNFETKLNGRRVSTPYLEVNGNQNGVLIDQPIDFEGSSINARIEQRFGSPAKVALDGVIERQTLVNSGVRVPAFIRGDRFPMKAEQVQTNLGNAYDVTLDLTPLTIDAPAIVWQKPAGARGTASARVFTQNGVTDLSNLAFQMQGAEGQGRARVQKGAFSIDLERFALANIYTGDLHYVSGAPVKLTANGERLNVPNVKFRPSGNNNSNTSTDILANIRQVQLTDSILATNVEATLRAQNGVVGSVYGNIGGKTPVNVEISRQNGLPRYVLLSNDAGGFLRNTGAFQDFRGGDLRAELRATGAPQSYQGNAVITDTRLEDSRVGIQLLQAASIVGLLDIANNEGIYFSEISGDITITPAQVVVAKGKAVGPTIGLSMSGQYNRRARYIDVSGVLTPAYLFNGFLQQVPVIGRVIGGREGEGVIGMSYDLYGPLGNTTVVADPLSLFTPGVLREIWGEIKSGVAKSIEEQGSGSSGSGSSGSGSAGSAGSLPGSLF